MDLRNQIAFVRTWFGLLVGAVVLAAVAGYVVSSFLPKVYEAKTTVLVGQALSAVSPDYTELQVSQLLAPTYAAVAETRPFLDKVLARLGLADTPDALADRIRVESPLGTSLLFITVQDPDPIRAAAIANQVASELIAASPAADPDNEVLQRAIDAQFAAVQVQLAASELRLAELGDLDERTPEEEAEIAALGDRLVALRATFANLLAVSTGSPANALTVIEPAVPSTVPVSPRVLFNTLLAAALGLLVAGAIAFAFDWYRTVPTPSTRTSRKR